MIIGIPKERKIGEYRVSTTPSCVGELIREGHTVFVEESAGIHAGFSDQDFQKSGAKICKQEQTWDVDMVVKVKEPITEEFRFLRKDLIVFSYLHLAGNSKKLTLELIKKSVTGIGMETVEDTSGTLILAYPMSAIAGRMAVQIGAQYLAKNYGGSGKLIDSVPAVIPTKVVVIGAGTAGSFAAKAASNRGASVVALDIRHDRLDKLSKESNEKISTVLSTKENITREIQDADLVIGAALIPGAKTPQIVSESMVKSMKKGSVIVDIAIDQGGCFETSKPLTHKNPSFIKYGIVHYAVPNMPGIYPTTATQALAKYSLFYIKNIAKSGVVKAIKNDAGLFKGLNTFKGKITFKPVAEALGLEDYYSNPEKLL